MGVLLIVTAGIVAGCAGAGSMTSAAYRNDPDRIDALVAKGFDVNAPEPGGALPLEYATTGGHVEATERLLYHGANVDIRNKEGRTSLFHVARNGRPEDMARLLLRYDADADLADYFGMTPLMIAAARGHMNIVEILLAHGVEVDSRDSLGRTARDVALAHDNPAIVARLADLGVDATEFPPTERPSGTQPLPVEGCGTVVDSTVLSSRFWCGVPYAVFARDTGIMFGIERYANIDGFSVRVDGDHVSIDEPDCSKVRLSGPMSPGGAPLAHRQSILRRGARVATVTFIFDTQRRLLGLRCDNTAPGVSILEGFSDLAY